MAKTHFIACALGVTLLLFTMLTAASGRWTRSDNASKELWGEHGLWRYCQCRDNQVGNCKKENNYWRTLQAFAVMGIIPVYFACIVMGLQIFNHPNGNKGLFGLTAILIIVAVVFNIVTWATAVGVFKKDNMCIQGQLSYHDLGWKLDWAFGIHLLEFGFLLIALVCAAVLAGRSEGAGAPLNAATFIILLFCLLCATFAVANRGWMEMEQANHVYREIGLFDVCSCIKSGDQACSDRRRMQRAQQAFAVVSIFFYFVGLCVLTKGPALKAVQGLLFGIGGVCSLLLMAIFAAFFNQSYCGSKIDQGFKLHWAFGLQIVVIVLAFVVVGAACAGTDDSEEGAAADEEKKEEAEPTA
jgi:hypothetical protein